MNEQDPQDCPDAREPASPSLDDFLIEEDMPCIQCSYNLRGLRDDGQCPECGTPIEKTVDYVMQRVLCPACLAPNHPSQALCLACRSPLTGSGATANYYRMVPTGNGRKKRDYDAEPEPPPAGPLALCLGLGISALILLAEMIWSTWYNPLDPAPLTESIASKMLWTLTALLLAILPVGLIYSSFRSFRKKRREFLPKYAAFMEKERAADAEEAARQRTRPEEAADDPADDADAP